MGQRAKWKRRESSDTPACSVPGCHATAVATLRTHDADERCWLVDGVGTDGEHICRRHADDLRAAPGWVLHDERERQATARRSVEVARRARPIAGGRGAASRVDLRRSETTAPVDDLLDAQSPLLSRAFAKSRD
jgi:hypothetical protein